jgi:cell wall-associated NlpC family hydrolase
MNFRFMQDAKFYGLILCLFLIVGCSPTRTVSYKSSDYHKKERLAKTKTVSKSKAKKDTRRARVNSGANSVLDTAYGFLGTPYKYGGVTKSGLDCSGLVINAYHAAGIQMPRVSREQAKTGKEVRLRDVQQGDLVFFKTSGSSINHVGIVDKVIKGEVFFIHSSTSKGVIISSLEETYWNRRFVKATRVL